MPDYQSFFIMNNLDNVNQNIFTRVDDRLTRGHNMKLKKLRVKTEFRKNIFSNRIIDDWNSLPQNIVEAPTLNIFKSRLNKFWVGQNKFHAKCYE